MRTVIIAVVAAVCGVALGMAVMHQRAAAELEELRQTRNTALEEAAILKRQADAARERGQALERDNAAHAERVETLEREVSGLREAAVRAEAAPPSPEPEAGPDAFAFPELPLPEPPPEAESREEERRPRFWRGGFSPSRMREDFRDFLSAQSAQSTDPAEQDRLGAISEYADYLFDLREQWRNAEDDAARDALRDQFITAMGEARQLMEDQKHGMMAQLAQTYGISASQQDAFIQSLQSLMENPMFRTMPMWQGPMATVRGAPSIPPPSAP
ncbi:MAG: hypothetical protein KA184_01510 [Candidatus Hydrogenedentes bacterium]|nr:hypothetical protein [Candidatus Hydrogenedentota bacterium]